MAKNAKKSFPAPYWWYLWFPQKFIKA